MSRRNKDRNRTQVAATMSATDAIPSGDSALVSQFMSAMDSYQNGPARLGEGTNNQVNSGAYPLTRITNDYMLMLSLYRSVSVVRRIVDCKAEDILKDFPKLSSQITPQQIDRFEQVVRKTGTLEGLRTALKWGRLFGGGVGLICLKGVKDLMEPLAVEDVEPGSYLGILPLDRWSGITPGPSLITDISYPPDFGLPEWYACVMGNSVVNVHHTRLLRFTGRELPLWERQTVLYWGLSEVEPIWDSLRINDYTKWNISSLVTRAQIFWMVDKELAAIQSGLGGNNAAFVRRVQRMKALSDAMNNQGLGILGEGGDVKQHTFSFGGLADIREKQMMDLASDAGYPFEILYGRQSGLGSNGESGLQLYYDGIEQARKQEAGPKMDKLIPVIAMSTFGEVPDDLDYTWPPVRTMSNKERAELADKTTTAIVSLYNSDLLTKKEARMEQKQASDANGLCSNITDEALAATPDKYASEMGGGELDLPDDGEGSAADAAAMDAEWNESDHPRAENGEFGSGGGGGSASVGLKSHESRESWPEHIKVLKIPPAWKDVRVSDNPDADLLAIGKDTKGRPQYVYSQKFQQSQAALKFARIKSLESDAPMIKDQLSTLTKSNDRKVADHADCANLIFKMGIRPGSDSDTKAKVKAYGATTLEGKHVVTEGDETYLRFTGKKGVAINLHVDDPELASNLRKRAGDAGENGRLFGGVRGGSLLDFVHGELDHGGYKTKDFRTLLANNQASDVIARMPAPKSEKEYKKAVLEVAKQVSAKLGNTPTVALQSYINPAVFGAWRESYAVA